MTDVALQAGVLASASREVPVDVLAAHLMRHYRLAGDLTPLTGERDRNYRLSIDGNPKFVVKVAHPGEMPPIIRAQARAANHVRALDPSIPVQAVCLTSAGEPVSTLEHAGESRVVRVVDWLSGRVMADGPPTPALAVSIGSTLARLGTALRSFDDPHAAQDLLWDLSNAARLRSLLPGLQGDPLVGEVEQALVAYEAIAPALGILPRQAIHADFNPHNLLVDDSSSRVVGVLDFGDMQVAPLVCDLAIACAYLTGPSERPFDCIESAVAAYHRVLPFGAEAAAMLVDLIAMRHAMTVLITEWRARRQPESAAYILRNNPAARRGLHSLGCGGRRVLTRTVAQILAG